MPIIGALCEMPVGRTVMPNRQGEGVTDGVGNLHTQLKVKILAEVTRKEYLEQFMGNPIDIETMKLAYHPEARFYHCEFV